MKLPILALVLLSSVLVPAAHLNVQAILALPNTQIVIEQAAVLQDVLDKQFGEEVYLTTMARIYQEARVVLAKKTGLEPFIIDISALIKVAADNPAQLQETVITLEISSENQNQARVLLASPTRVNAALFPSVTLDTLAGDTVAVIGIGGGSDCIQATQLASLLPQDKKVAALISVRTAKPSSAGASGNMDESRTVTHAQVVTDGVYRVTAASTGTGRFFENLPAEKYPTYLVIDDQQGDLASRIAAALMDAGGVQTIIAVDTGGDALFPMEALDNQGHSTPDQDLRVLKALSAFTETHTIYTAEIAVGVDSPANAEEVLRAAQARYYQLSAQEAHKVLAQYAAWGMDGSDEGRYGKTSLTWQAALAGHQGLYVLPLPKKVVIDQKNPWIPFVIVQPSMAGIFLMDLDKHIHALSK